MITLRERLTGVSRALAALPSLAYALIYVLLIPAFALVYYVFRNDFYHSTVQYEQSMNDDANQILLSLSKEIRDTFKTTHNSEQVAVHGWTVDSNSFSSYSLKVAEGEVSFALEVKLVKQGNFYHEAHLLPRIKYLLRERLAVLPPGANDWIDEKLIKLDSLSLAIISGDKVKEIDLARTIFPYNYETFGPDVIVMPIPRELDTKIRGFVSGTRGFPSELSGSFVRMFYLSAVTITTLGYGDILPLTTRSRILISLEAILGIVVAGLFLNALAHERNTISV
jgi:Ion channel